MRPSPRLAKDFAPPQFYRAKTAGHCFNRCSRQVYRLTLLRAPALECPHENQSSCPAGLPGSALHWSPGALAPGLDGVVDGLRFRTPLRAAVGDARPRQPSIGFDRLFRRQIILSAAQPVFWQKWPMWPIQPMWPMQCWGRWRHLLRRRACLDEKSIAS